MYKHMYGDFTKDEKEKSQYQDTSRSKAEKGHGDRPWEMLYDDVVDPAALQPSEETFGAFPLVKKLSLRLFGVDDYLETHPSALTDTILCLQTIFVTLP